MPPFRRKLFCLLPLELGYARDILRGVSAYEPRSPKWSIVAGGIQGATEILNRQSDALMITMANISMPLREGQFVVNVSDNGNPSFPQVIPQNEDVGRIAARYLMELGYERFAFAGDNLPYSKKRLSGFLEELSCHDQAVHTITHDRSTRYPAFLSNLEFPCAVYASSDKLAQRLLEVARDLGIGVPLDLAILGTDNDACLCETATPRLSSIDIGGYQVGLHAAKRMEQLISGAVVPSPILIPPNGIESRGSTAKRVSTDRYVNRALSYIHEHALEGITVEHVSAQIGYSAKTLQKKFRQEFGESAKEEIRRQQFERAKELLRTTNLPILDVALSCGFHHAGRFSGEFTKRMGTTPARYRRARSG